MHLSSLLYAAPILSLAFAAQETCLRGCCELLTQVPKAMLQFHTESQKILGITADKPALSLQLGNSIITCCPCEDVPRIVDVGAANTSGIATSSQAESKTSQLLTTETKLVPTTLPVDSGCGSQGPDGLWTVCGSSTKKHNPPIAACWGSQGTDGNWTPTACDSFGPIATSWADVKPTSDAPLVCGSQGPDGLWTPCERRATATSLKEVRTTPLKPQVCGSQGPDGLWTPCETIAVRTAAAGNQHGNSDEKDEL